MGNEELRTKDKVDLVRRNAEVLEQKAKLLEQGSSGQSVDH